MSEQNQTIDLIKFQDEVAKWAAYNFPKAQPHQPLLGAYEELGELTHAHLKLEQGIRGTKLEHMEAKADAIGDALVYLAHYCAINNLNLNNCVSYAWNQVKHRDWIKFPKNGVSE